MADNVAALLRLMLVTDDRLAQGRDIALALAASEVCTSVQLRRRGGSAQLAQLVRGLIAAPRTVW